MRRGGPPASPAGAGTPGGTVSFYNGTVSAANLLGTASYGGTSQGAVNAGSYTIAPTGLFSNQQGYIITYANGSTLEDPAITYGIVFSNFMSKGVWTFEGGTDRLIGLMHECRFGLLAAIIGAFSQIGRAHV